MVIKNTTFFPWANVNVFDYPCAPARSSVAISPNGVIACGSMTGVMWIWTLDMGCWARRLMPVAEQVNDMVPLDNVHFARLGEHVLYSYRGQSTVHMAKVLPLHDFGVCDLWQGKKGSTVGQTVVFCDSTHGATALGGSDGTAVAFWRISKREGN